MASTSTVSVVVVAGTAVADYPSTSEPSAEPYHSPVASWRGKEKALTLILRDNTLILENPRKRIRYKIYERDRRDRNSDFR